MIIWNDDCVRELVWFNAVSATEAISEREKHEDKEREVNKREQESNRPAKKGEGDRKWEYTADRLIDKNMIETTMSHNNIYHLLQSSTLLITDIKETGLSALLWEEDNNIGCMFGM